MMIYAEIYLVGHVLCFLATWRGVRAAKAGHSRAVALTAAWVVSWAWPWYVLMSTYQHTRRTLRPTP